MSKPWTHAESSARKFGGKPEDYIKIHENLDAVKAAVPDNRGRFLTHNSFYIYSILPQIFGTTITNSDGKVISVSLIGEQHVSEDFGGRFIPSVQDYVEAMEMQDWMNNGMGNTFPPSYRKINERQKTKRVYRVD
jgi:hypothetical protein